MLQGKKLASPTPPAEGERRAARGYTAQYRIAGRLIYDALLANELEWVRVADPDAGRVDDIQIGYPGRLDAYQVKWSEFVESITFKGLLKETKTGKKIHPSLIHQLSDGWKRLKKANPEREVKVHLISRSIPSTHDSPGVSPIPQSRRHFQSFLLDCWSVRKAWSDTGCLDSIPDGWKKAVNNIQIASFLDDSAFLEFIQTCGLHFVQSDGTNDLAYSNSRRNRDIESIADYLWKLIGKEKNVVQIERNELLISLGWEKRFDFRFKHDFYVDEVLYQPIQSTIDELDKSISAYSQGYIAMLGTPGSGKSTTLTQGYRYRYGFRVVRYYAYVRDDTSPQRGEAQNFLHDLVLALYREGFRGRSDSNFPENRQEFLDTLGSQLGQLNEDWITNKTKTLILIDGLDHIEREQNPARSLIADLPPPDQIPDGVIFLLGSQKVELDGINPRIPEHLKVAGRTLIMAPLARTAIHRMIDAAGLGEKLSFDQKEKVVELSGGHPLALSYLLKKIYEAGNTDEVEMALDSSEPYSGNIEQDYKIYWNKLKEDSEVRNLLGLLCRLRGAIDLVVAMQWVDEATIERFMCLAKHYFSRDTASRWFFFHNSFKQFLLDETGRNSIGLSSDAKDAEFHRQLAIHASQADLSSPWSWEAIYHFASSGETNQVLKLFTQEYFRRQYFSLRPFGEIRADIAISMQEAARANDVLAVIRGLLIEKELLDRDECLNDVDIPKLLLQVFGPDTAIDAVVRGRELLVDEESALKICQELISVGEEKVARRIFDAAEPLGVLSGTEKLKDWHDSPELTVWAKVAHFFRPLKAIFSAIDKVQIEPNRHFNQNLDQANENIRDQLRTSVVDAIYENGLFKLSELESALSSIPSGERYIERFDFYKAVDAVRGDFPIEEGMVALDRLLEKSKQAEFDQSDRILVAEAIFRLRKDPEQAKAWLEGIGQPDLWDWPASAGFAQFSDRIRINRILSALGESVDPLKAVPSSPKERDHGTVLFERMLVLAANVWGEAWLGNMLSPEHVIRELTPAIRFYYKRWEETHEWSNWHSFSSMAPEYFEYLIFAVAAHGPKARDAFVEHLEAHWNNQTYKKYWFGNRKRSVAIAHFRAGGLLGEFRRRLNNLDSEVISVWDEPNERITELSDQIEAWLVAEKPERAKHLLNEMMETSFGIAYDKDHQFTHWIKWANRTNYASPTDMVARMLPLVAGQAVLHKAHRNDAGERVLEAIVSQNPAWARDVHKWLLDAHGVSFIESISGLLRGAASRSDSNGYLISFAIAHLVIPFQRGFDRDFGEDIGRYVGVVSPDDNQRVLSPLIAAINTKAYPSNRIQWIESLESGLKSAGVDTHWIQGFKSDKPEKENSGSSLKSGVYLKNGKFLDEVEVQGRIKSFSQMIDLLSQIEKAEYMHWENIVESFVDCLSESEIPTLVAYLSKFKISSRCLALLAKRYLQLGQVEKAQIMAEDIISSSAPGGWNRRWDGGSRLSAFEIVIEIEGDQGRKKALDCFVKDYLSEYRYPRDLLWQLDDLCTVFFDSTPVKKVWNEIENHICQLADIKLAKKFPPEAENNNSIGTNLVLQLMIDALQHPVLAVRSEARNGLCHIVVNAIADKELLPMLAEALKGGNEELQMEVLAVLEAIVENRIVVVEFLANRIIPLCHAESMLVRGMAQSLATSIGQSWGKEAKGRGELSPIYRMDLPEFPLADRSVFFDDLPLGQTLPDTKDPLEMVRPFHDALEVLSEISGIPIENLVNRVAMLMPTLSPEKEWNNQAEQNVRQWLKSSNFELAYRRPRVLVAHRAFGHVVGELMDSNVVGSKSLGSLAEWLLIHDPQLSMILPQARPINVVVSSGDEMGDYPRKDWIDNGHESFSLLIDRYNDEMHVLGEWSRFVKMERGQPSEVRKSNICDPRWAEDDRLPFFPRKSSWSAASYPNLPGLREIPAVVISGFLRMSFKDWYGLNPWFGYSMGWHIDKSGLLRWVDEKENPMVESVCWQDGCLSYRESFGMNEVCGEGWLVVAYPDAIKQLEGFFPGATRVSVVERSLSNNDEDMDNNKQSARRLYSAWV